MSPGTSPGKDLDSRTDLFSFGAVLYEMATGSLPFRGNTTAAVFNSILNKTADPPVRLNPDLPPELERIINKALERDVDLRYQTAAEMRGDFKRLKRETESGKSETVVIANSLAQRPVRFGFIHAAILLAVVIFLVTTFFWLRQPLPAPRVLSTTQLTHDNLAKSALVTDGPRLYFNESLGEKSILSQVSTTGGDIANSNSSLRTPIFTTSHPAGPNFWWILSLVKEGSSPPIRLRYGPFLYLPDPPPHWRFQRLRRCLVPRWPAPCLCRRPRPLSRKMGRYRTAQVSNLYGIPLASEVLTRSYPPALQPTRSRFS